MGGKPKFGEQCQECLTQVGRLVALGKVPLEIDTGKILLAKVDRKAVRKKGGRTGLGGAGNSKRRRYDAYMRSRSWRAIRDFVMRRDSPDDDPSHARCQDCGAPATCCAHLRYPRDIRDTRPEDCQASCKRCNDSERTQRIFRQAMGE